MRFVVTALLLVFASAASAQDWELVWSDEFDGTSLDTSKWRHQIGNGCPDLCGWGNNELQYYREENATVGDGVLRITAREQRFIGYDYTSARIRSANLGDWTYGRFEMRAKLPVGQGMWPAFWLLPTDSEYGVWAASGEIDAMEARGQNPEEVLGTIHYGGTFPGNRSTSGATTDDGPGDLTTDFHTYAVEWTPCEMRWYFDGELYSTKTNWFSENGPYPAPFDRRFHLLLNLAVGGNFVGAPDATTVFPQEFVVDYVRVYQQQSFERCAVIFDGMDHGNPFGNEWFSFDGSVGGGGIDANFTDLLPNVACRAALQAGYGGGGASGFYGGFGRRNATDLTGYTHFSFWMRPDADQSYQLEINLQDDDDGDGNIPANPDGADDEWQAVVSVGGPGSDVIAGGGWQRVDIPFSEFVDDDSFHFGGNGMFDPYAGGELINVVWAVIGEGTPVTFRTDEWWFTRQDAIVVGRIFEDLDGDGVDDGEPGIPGVTVELVDAASGIAVDTRVTESAGGYAFFDEVGGTYEVRVAGGLPAGLEPTGDPDGVESPGVTGLVLACDGVAATESFGYRGEATDAPSSRRGVTLAQNVPNPFNPSTTIAFTVPDEADVSLAVFDVAGRRVRTLVRGTRAAGRHEVIWDGRDDAGRSVAGAVYFYTLRAGDVERTRRMTLVK